MSVNVTLSIPLSTFLDIKAGRNPPSCSPDIYQTLLKAIRSAPCEVVRSNKPPLRLEASPTTSNKKITYTKVTRFRKPDDPPIDGVLLSVDGSLDYKRYRIDHWTKMSALKEAVSRTTGLDGREFAMYYDNCKIQDLDTPESVGFISFLSFYLFSYLPTYLSIYLSLC